MWRRRRTFDDPNIFILHPGTLCSWSVTHFALCCSLEASLEARWVPNDSSRLHQGGDSSPNNNISSSKRRWKEVRESPELENVQERRLILQEFHCLTPLKVSLELQDWVTSRKRDFKTTFEVVRFYLCPKWKRYLDLDHRLVQTNLLLRTLTECVTSFLSSSVHSLTCRDRRSVSSNIKMFLYFNRYLAEFQMTPLPSWPINPSTCELERV